MKLENKIYLLDLVKSIVSGALIGVTIALYKYAAHFIQHLSNEVFTSSELYKIIIGIISFIILMFVSFFLTKIDGNIQGGGLPQLEINTRHDAYNTNMKWYKSLPLMFINSIISFFCGLTLGSEAPSVFMGGNIGILTNDLFKRKDDKDNVFISMGAGFSTAFMSPLAGLFYTFEECFHKSKIGFKNLLRIILMIVTSYFVAYFINNDLIVVFNISNEFAYEYFYVFFFVLLLDIIVGLLILYLMPLIKKFFNKHYTNFFIKYRLFIMFLISLACLLLYPSFSGSGLNIIDNIFSYTNYLIVILLIVGRLFLFLLVGNSTASGGLLVPTLTLGALNGLLVSLLSEKFFNFPIEQFPLLILLSMISLFVLVNKTPLTGIALAISIGGYKNFMVLIIPTILMVGLSYMVTMLLKLEGLNEIQINLLRTSRNIKLE